MVKKFVFGVIMATIFIGCAHRPSKLELDLTKQVGELKRDRTLLQSRVRELKNDLTQTQKQNEQLSGLCNAKFAEQRKVNPMGK